MKIEINNVKGTHDIIGGEAVAYSGVENLMKSIAELYGFNEVRPPVLEHSEIFVRGVGESSDVVRKEMYTFSDKGGRSLTLRPEFTAGIMRLIVQNKLLATSELPLKSYYVGPVFRYERPQLGRYRQFNQFGVESVGHASYMADVEVIALAYTILQSLGLVNVKVKINTLGDEATRNAYREALKTYFADKIDNMCPDCKSRLELNPLRILDCKVPEDQEIVKGAPKMSKYLSKESKDRFDLVLNELKKMEIPYEIDDTLVRGLDYYSDTVFEFHYTSSQGNNYGAIGAGGHYDKLVSEMGGPDLPGVGFSFGVERIVSVLTDDNLIPSDLANNLDFYVMTMGEKARAVALNVATATRLLGYKCDMCFDDVKLGNQFKRAEKRGAKFAIILGDNEIDNNKVIIKNMKTQEQIEIDKQEFEDRIVELMEQASHEHTCGCGCEHDHEEGECCCGGEHHHEHGCCCENHKKEGK